MQLNAISRRRYTVGRTPITKLCRLSEALGGPNIYIKRDDMLGLAGGGNKTRKLEFVVADALSQGADTLVTSGAVQSNHCRLTLAAAAREGLKCRLVIEERVPHSYDPRATGNNLLFDLLGVEKVKVVPADSDVMSLMRQEMAALKADGRHGYVIPGGASNGLGALGYVACAKEILQQCFEDNLRIDQVVCASGSGGTHAGLVAGMWESESKIGILGVSTRAPSEQQEPKVHGIARDCFHILEIDRELPVEAVRVLDGYVGEGYSLPTQAMIEAVRMFARLEGILLDPVYTGKAAAGLIGLVREGKFDSHTNVLFLHTGGAPSLYAYAESFLS